MGVRHRIDGLENTHIRGLVQEHVRHRIDGLEITLLLGNVAR